MRYEIFEAVLFILAGLQVAHILITQVLRDPTKHKDRHR